MTELKAKYPFAAAFHTLLNKSADESQRILEQMQDENAPLAAVHKNTDGSWQIAHQVKPDDLRKKIFRIAEQFSDDLPSAPKRVPPPTQEQPENEPPPENPTVTDSDAKTEDDGSGDPPTAQEYPDDSSTNAEDNSDPDRSPLKSDDPGKADDSKQKPSSRSKKKK